MPNNHTLGAARTKFGFANIIKSFYDDHAEIAGIFMILKAVDYDDLDRSVRSKSV